MMHQPALAPHRRVQIKNIGRKAADCIVSHITASHICAGDLPGELGAVGVVKNAMLAEERIENRRAIPSGKDAFDVRAAM